MNRAFWAALLLVIGVTASAQDSSFRSMSVGRVRLLVPVHWTVMTDTQRRDVAAASEALLEGADVGAQPTKTADFSIHAPPEPSGAVIKATTFTVAPEDRLTQAELIREVTDNPSEAMAKIQAGGKAEIDALAAAVRRNSSITILEPRTTKVEAINGKLAIVLRYRRTGSEEGITFNVTQYHFPLGAEKVLVMLSYREQDGLLYSTILHKVKSSIEIP